MGAGLLQSKAAGPQRCERPCRGSFRPFTMEQTSPAGRAWLGQVGRIRKCVFVISADMRIRGEASSLPRRLFSLSRAGLLSKPREDKQHRLASRGPVCLLLSLPVCCSAAATSRICFRFFLTELGLNQVFKGRLLQLQSIFFFQKYQWGSQAHKKKKKEKRLEGRSPNLPEMI